MLGPAGEGVAPFPDARALEGALGGAFATVEVHGRLGSTNRRAAQLSSALPALVVCREQTAGRGRRGRTWASSGGSSLTLSVAQAAAGTVPAGLSLAAAVGAAEAVEARGFPVRLKWPNDLVGQSGGKVGGILVEAGGGRAVAGIGINLADFAGLEAEPGAESLSAQGAEVDGNSLAAEVALCVLARLDGMLGAGGDSAMAEVRRQWLARSAHGVGDRIMVTQSDGTKEAMEYLGIGDEGELLAKTAGGAVLKVLNAEVTA